MASKRPRKATFYADRGKKPALNPIDTASIPTDMKHRKQWVGWRLTWNDKAGKWDKPPIDLSTGYRLQWSDRSAWLPFDEVVNAYCAKRIDGIGYIFSEDDPFTGIDLDDAIDAGDKPLPWADKIISELRTYTEYSPSLTGYKLILNAKLPAGCKNEMPIEDGGIEVYDRGRYFTITGVLFKNFGIESRQAELNVLLDRLGMVKRQAKQEQRHKSDGDTPDAKRIIDALRFVRNADGYWPWLRVGMALHDWSQTEGLGIWCDWSSSSNKYSEEGCQKKWKSFTTGGGITIRSVFDLAIKGGWRPPEPKATFGNSNVNADDRSSKQHEANTQTPEDNSGLEFTKLSTIKAKPIKWLVPKRFPRGKVILLAADGGSGKSTLTRSIAANVSRGFCALGLDYPSPGAGDVLLCAAEDSYEEIVIPHLIAEKADLDRVYQVHHVKTEPDGSKFKVHLKLEHIAELKEKIRQHPGIKLIVIDPVISLVSGARLSNNQGEEVRVVLDPLNKLADDTGVAIIVIAHLNKAATNKATYRVSGSAQWIAGVRVAYMVAPDPDDPTQRLLIPVKRNILGLEEEAATFRLTRLIDLEADEHRNHPALAELSDEDFVEVITQMARVTYGHTKKVNADEVFAPKKPEDTESCEQWIKKRLGTQYAWPDSKIEEEAEQAGYSKSQYRRAKGKLRSNDGLRSKPLESGGPWYVGFGIIGKMPIAPDQVEPPTEEGSADTEKTDQSAQTDQTNEVFDQSVQSDQSDESSEAPPRTDGL